MNVTDKPESNPSGLNSYNSLNRAVRIKELARVSDDNKSILNRLQGTRSHYSTEKWNYDFESQRKLIGNIYENGDRFCKNPYFLHSVCTQQDAFNSQQPYYSVSNPNLNAFGGGIGNNSRRSARSSQKRLLKNKRTSSAIDSTNNSNYQMNRPYSAPKVQGTNKRAMSAHTKRRPRVHSGRVKKINQYLSE